MIIECTGSPFTYRWPGGEVNLEPEKPIDLPYERARRLLLKARGRVRVIYQPGDQITRTRGDGTTHVGVVDFIHVVEAGMSWAFVSFGNSWAVINVNVLRLAEEP